MKEGALKVGDKVRFIEEFSARGIPRQGTTARVERVVPPLLGVQFSDGVTIEFDRDGHRLMCNGDEVEPA